MSINKEHLSFHTFLNFVFRSRTKASQQCFAASLIQVGGASNIVRPIAVDFETHDSQPLYQEPFAALNTAADDDTKLTRFMKFYVSRNF